MHLQEARRLWTDPALRRNPYPALAVLRAAGPVHPVVFNDDLPAFAVVGYDEARRALTDPRLLKDPQRLPEHLRPHDPLAGAGLGRHLLNLDAPEHTAVRRLVAGAFTPARVRALRPDVERLAATLAARIAGPGSVDLLENFAVPLTIGTISALLGVPADTGPAFRGWVQDLVAPHVDADRRAAAGLALAGYVLDRIAAARRAPRDDLLDALVAARDGAHRLADEQLLSTVFLLLVAGYETTASLIGNAVAALWRHPDQLAAVQADPTRIPAAVEEVLRFDTAAGHCFVRWASEPLELAGVAVPRHAAVVVVLAAANHDETRTPDAHRLDIARPPAPHLAFGHGAHFCLGAPLARLEAQVALRTLTRHLPHLALDERVTLDRRSALLIPGWCAVPVVPGAWCAG